MIVVAVVVRPVKFQSTPPRGERPCELIRCGEVCGISIHAPARGATLGVSKTPTVGFISIHAPARGATLAGKFREAWNEFQSTPPRGERRIGADILSRLMGNFNPRPREGSDGKYCSFLLYQSSFLKQYSQISIFSNYTNIESTILIRYFPSANLSDISC